MKQNKCYLFPNSETVFGKEINLDPYINTEREIFLSFDARSIGSELSVLFAGFCFYDENKNIIYSHQVLRYQSPLIIIDIIDLSTIIVSGNATEDWEENKFKILGIYFDGNIDKLPDRVTHKYSEVDREHPTSIKITLDTPLTNKEIGDIIRGVTIVMPHYSGEIYNYCAARGVIVPQKFRHYSGTLKCSEKWGCDNNYLRIGTRYIKVLFLVNHRGTINSELLIKNVTIGIKL